jgi:hypothetical protein
MFYKLQKFKGRCAAFLRRGAGLPLFRAQGEKKPHDALEAFKER